MAVFEPATGCLEGRFTTGGLLQLSWSGPVCLSSGYGSMSPVSAPFWHAAGTGTPAGCKLLARARSGTSSAARSRCLRSYMRAVGCSCWCTSCCTKLTLRCQCGGLKSVVSWPKSGLPGPSSPCGDTRSKASVPLFKEASIPIWGCPGVCIRDGYPVVWRSQTDSIAS